MAAYLISYDLSAPGRDYSGLYEAIEACGTWWHYLESTWMIITTDTPQQIWDKLSANLNQNDTLLIIEVRNNVGGWLPEDAWTWINQNVPN